MGTLDSDNVSESDTSESSQHVLPTPLRRSTRPPTPRKSLPGMVQPSADSQITVPLPQGPGSVSSRKSRSQNVKTSDSQSLTINSSPPGSQPSVPRRKRKNTASQATAAQGSQRDAPSDTEMNQDSNNGLTDRQKTKRTKVLHTAPKEPEYAAVVDYFGVPEHKPNDDREETLGLFPFSATLPVIAEEDEESDLSTPIVIDIPEEETNVPDEVDTDHDSEGDATAKAAPDYDEEEENQADTDDPTIALEAPILNGSHTNSSRKHANRLNSLISKANFVSRRVARSAVWRLHYSRIAKSMNLKLLPLTPGYNATRWNAEFDSLNRLVQARKVVNRLLADDLDLIKMKKRRKGSKKPRGYFHEIFFSPDDWTALEELTNELVLGFDRR
ncbi:uncharacterized protein MELLADRAFT_67076 [Melampsora larici-populina 98AG31]|uniref:Uncharacterized protein n=1 Tax=Melampsora larici-populina (strain 98AG31 / pathotype 3-4-7) TaxID=747676 RepID=F4S1P7_MELLP|nr:uncharacterized protein MELLADRAFT_67076 [Melampsora larici-populina 98AG31]EGG01413.1 hypothetical protein MELLADRAFT_67076 [Melampsora larici-populina 98AG31]